MALTDFGLETLADLTKLYKADPDLLTRWNREYADCGLPRRVTYRLEILGDLAVLVDHDRAGSVSRTGLMSTLGAGTRSQRWHKARLPIKLAATLRALHKSSYFVENKRRSVQSIIGATQNLCG